MNEEADPHDLNGLLNACIKSVLNKYNLNLEAKLIPPVSYLDMLVLLKNCGLVMTDSGGLQKEAYFLDKYCITLRNETEWIELVNNGYNVLVGSNINSIGETFNRYFSKKISKKIELYGGGNAVKNIIKVLRELQ